MLHLCIDARLYQASGIGTFLKAALYSLASQSKYRMTLLGKEQERKLFDSSSFTFLAMQSPIYSASEQLEYPRLIPQCDLFWSPHFNVPLLPIRAKKRLVTVHDLYHLAFAESLTWKERFYAKTVYQAAFTLSDLVTTISHFSKAEIEKYAFRKPKHLMLLSPGLDNHFLQEPILERKHLLFVGNLKPHKNLVRLVEAYERVAPSEPLFIVGKKEGLLHADSKLKEIIDRSPFLKRQVHLTGYVADDRLKELYAQAKLFLFPSLYEGFGYPPLEAMAYGCPVLASRAAAIPEVCESAVEYVDPYSVASIASGLHYLLNNPDRCEELSQKGRELFKQKKKQTNAIGDVIDACCGSS